MLIGLDPASEERPATLAVLAESWLLHLDRALERGGGEARQLRAALPADGGIDLTRDRDYLAVTVTTTGTGAALALAFLRHQLLEAPLSAEIVEAAKRGAAARRQQWLQSVVEPTQELLLRALYGLPLGRPFYGTADQLAAVTGEEVMRLRARLLVQGNVVVAALVPTQADALRGAAEAVCAALPAASSPAAWAPPASPTKAVEVEDNPDLEQASLIVGAPMPPFGHPDYWAACLLRELLAGPEGSLAKDRALVAGLGLLVPPQLDWREWPVQVLGVEVGAHPCLGVHVWCHPARIEEARRGVVGHLQAIAAGAFDAAELLQARIRVSNMWARQIASLGDRARYLAVATRLGTALPDARQVAETVQALGRKQVCRLAQEALRRLAVGVQMPRS
jgi:predicted Zn-dependent peptidase